jgi:hypothetical protein
VAHAEFKAEQWSGIKRDVFCGRPSSRHHPSDSLRSGETNIIVSCWSDWIGRIGRRGWQRRGRSAAASTLPLRNFPARWELSLRARISPDMRGAPTSTGGQLRAVDRRGDVQRSRLDRCAGVGDADFVAVAQAGRGRSRTDRTRSVSTVVAVGSLATCRHRPPATAVPPSQAQIIDTSPSTVGAGDVLIHPSRSRCGSRSSIS